MMMVSRGGGAKLGMTSMVTAVSVVRARCFSTATAPPGTTTKDATARFNSSNGNRCRWTWIFVGAAGIRNSATMSLAEKQQHQEDDKTRSEEGIESYWGVPPNKITKHDGTQWRWTCFWPWEAYTADLSIDLKKHHVPATILDKLAFWTVKTLRWPTDILFQIRVPMMLEEVAAVPGMVEGMLLHCRSLRRFEHSGGWIKALQEEAENERMHLMTFMEVAKAKVVRASPGGCSQRCFLQRLLSGIYRLPEFAHRVVGYLEEEAIHSYWEFLRELDNGNIENVAAPAIAVDYRRLPPPLHSQGCGSGRQG